MINEISGFQHVPFFERSLEGVCRCMPHISYLNSMDWFKGNFTGKPHNYFFVENHGFRCRFSLLHPSTNPVINLPTENTSFGMGFGHQGSNAVKERIAWSHYVRPFGCAAARGVPLRSRTEYLPGSQKFQS